MIEYKANELHFCGGQKNDAYSLVLDYHYSQRKPSATIFVGSFHLEGGLFGDQGEMLAAAIFGFPANQWSEPVIELMRLVRKDNIRVPLTRLIALSCKHLAKDGYDLIVSYADKNQGHEGIIYRACSWNYNGETKPQLVGVKIDGESIHGRSCVAAHGTRSPDKLRQIYQNKEIEPEYDIGKHLYWKALSKEGFKKAERLGLKSVDWNA